LFFLVVVVVFFFWVSFLNIVFGVCNFNSSFCFCFVCEWEKGKPLLCVLGNCSNKDPCHMQLGSFVK